jgi:hypothetical protein
MGRYSGEISVTFEKPKRALMKLILELRRLVNDRQIRNGQLQDRVT